MKIKAAVLKEMKIEMPYAESLPLKVEEINLDPPGPGEVLVKIGASGLCHSDLSVINGDRPRVMPMVLGHESSAEVAELGAGVTDFAVGDHVILVFVPSCGGCPSCRDARPALCEPGGKANAEGTLLSGGRRLSDKAGQKLNHHTGVSCFAEYAVVSTSSCVKVEQKISHQEAALFGCAVLTGAGAVINRANFSAGESAVVVGLGGVGFSALLAAVAGGARRLIAVDFSEEKLALAKELGATHTINPKNFESHEEMLSYIGGGVDYGFDMAGAVLSFETAYALTKKGGETITSGLPHPNAQFGLAIAKLVGEEKSIRGSYLGSGVPSRDIPKYIDLYLNGKLPVNKLMGKTFTLEQINEGFDYLASGDGLRAAIVFE